MTADENQRIATLTTGALKTTADSAVQAMLAAVEAAEEKTREMRAAVEDYIAEFQKVTGNLTEHVNSHVTFCQDVIDSFQQHHLNILNVEPPAEPVVDYKDEPKPRAIRTLESEFTKLRSTVPSIVSEATRR